MAAADGIVTHNNYDPTSTTNNTYNMYDHRLFHNIYPNP